VDYIKFLGEKIMKLVLGIRVITFGMLLACCALNSSLLSAASAPDFPATMINSPPLSKDGLKGKVIVLYYYEEGCPRCREAWPDKLKIAQSYKDKPVIFIAVNSGNPSAEVASYLSEVNCKWPTIVDQDRSFEKASGMENPISLQNIYQARIITPDGDFVPANSQALNQSVDQYLAKASWKLDPKEVPDPLKLAWQLMEIGNFNQAAAAVSNAQKALKDESGKAAADKIKAVIVSEYNNAIVPAKEAEAAGNAWTALKGYQLAAQQFSSLPETKELKAKITKLSTDPAVAREMKAAKLWNDAQTAARSPNAATQKRAIQQAQQVVRDYPNTEAATAAQAALDTLPK
jgi:thiol-disulfide isomerase/thioredoxin